MTRECHVRFCERLGVRLPGATLPTGTRKGASFPLGACIGLLSPTEHRTHRRTLPKNGCAVHLSGLDLNCPTQRATAETYRGATWVKR